VKLIETLKLAIAAIWAHKLRSALTLLGMIVGVTAFVVVVSLIEGFKRYVDEKIAGIGAKSPGRRRAQGTRAWIPMPASTLKLSQRTNPTVSPT